MPKYTYQDISNSSDDQFGKNDYSKSIALECKKPEFTIVATANAEKDPMIILGNKASPANSFTAAFGFWSKSYALCPKFNNIIQKCNYKSEDKSIDGNHVVYVTVENGRVEFGFNDPFGNSKKTINSVELPSSLEIKDIDFSSWKGDVTFKQISVVCKEPCDVSSSPPSSTITSDVKTSSSDSVSSENQSSSQATSSVSTLQSSESVFSESNLQSSQATSSESNLQSSESVSSESNLQSSESKSNDSTLQSSPTIISSKTTNNISLLPTVQEIHNNISTDSFTGKTDNASTSKIPSSVQESLQNPQPTISSDRPPVDNTGSSSLTQEINSGGNESDTSYNQNSLENNEKGAYHNKNNDKKQNGYNSSKYGSDFNYNSSHNLKYYSSVLGGSKNFNFNHKNINSSKSNNANPTKTSSSPPDALNFANDIIDVLNECFENIKKPNVKNLKQIKSNPSYGRPRVYRDAKHGPPTNLNKPKGDDKKSLNINDKKTSTANKKNPSGNIKSNSNKKNQKNRGLF
ncbi:hypothetical protein BB561_005134 [Smittium simulii]|uniref:Uncharacterized protein n=1 Tax=Smittium simulii TaxID=133385 RepID=A0A2T9YC35_9FUNG|nr:hypothetical protein BB561_005134 [Smittium simulii]